MKTMGRTRPYDSAEYLNTDAARAEYLTAALETADPSFILQAIGTVARASGGMTSVAREAGVSRENLTRSLRGKANPKFATLLRVFEVLGMALAVTLKASNRRKASRDTLLPPRAPRRRSGRDSHAGR
jgi:probable addiction module antidote protein